MIYLDTSVVLAQLLAEDRTPPEDLWSEDLVSSRLLEYEVWNRIHSRGLTSSHGDEVRLTLNEISMVQMVTAVVSRAAEPFPIPVRTLDALHLATLEFLRGQSIKIELATYDSRMRDAAKRMKIPLYKI